MVGPGRCEELALWGQPQSRLPLQLAGSRELLRLRLLQLLPCSSSSCHTLI